MKARRPISIALNALLVFVIVMVGLPATTVLLAIASDWLSK